MRGALNAAALAVFCLLVTSSVARGQSPPLISLLDTEFVGDNVLAPALNRDLANGITTYPIATSSGGLTYRFDPVLGLPSRSTRSFGPLFAERALTIGRRRFSVGINTQHASFDRYEGEDLTRLRLFSSAESADLGVLRVQLQADTTAFIMSAGVSSRLELGVVVPVTRIRMDATSEFNNPPFSSVERRTGSAEGFGDLQIKAKYNFRENAGGGVAAGMTLWLPTGDADNLLGTGTTRLKVFGIASAERGPVAPRVNVGITMPLSHLLTTVAFPFSRKSWRPLTEFNYSAGLDVIVSPRVTIASDIIGKIERNVFRFSYVKSGDDDLAPSFGPTRYGLRNQLLGSFGAKVNVHGRLLVTTSTLISLNGSGLTSRLGVVVGFERAF